MPGMRGLPAYSLRSADAGAILVARDAGITHAINATEASAMAAAANATGSVGATPYSSVSMSLVNPSAAACSEFSNVNDVVW